MYVRAGGLTGRMGGLELCAAGFSIMCVLMSWVSDYISGEMYIGQQIPYRLVCPSPGQAAPSLVSITTPSYSAAATMSRGCADTTIVYYTLYNAVTHVLP